MKTNNLKTLGYIMNPELKPMHSNLMQEYILLNNALNYTTDKNVYKAIQDRLESIAIEFCFEKTKVTLKFMNSANGY